MARQVMAGFGLKQRLAVCDALIDGATHEEAREVLRRSGVETADLPSDHSLNSYQESKEYQAQYQARVEAYRLENWEPPTVPDDWQPEQTLDQLAMRRLCMKVMTDSLDTSQLLQLVRSHTTRESQKLRQKQTELKETQMFADNVHGRARSAVVAQQGWAEHMMEITLEEIEKAQKTAAASSESQDSGGKPRKPEDNAGSKPTLPPISPQALTRPENIATIIAATANNLDRFAKKPPIRASA